MGNRNEEISIPVTEDVPPDCQYFLDFINRGGLIKPSNIVNDACVGAWEAYKRIIDNIESKKYFLSCKAHRSVFFKCLLIHMKSNDKFENMFAFKCVNDHPFESMLEKVSEKFFNLMAKNLVSETNSVTHSTKKRKPKAKKLTPANAKIRKLQSDT